MPKIGNLQTGSSQLRFGPYGLPRGLAVGDSVWCHYRRRNVVIGSISDAQMQWFQAGRGSGTGLIVCGDLVRAVQMESVSAVAHHWGICADTVSNWRRVLGVPRMNRGSKAVFQELFAGRLSDEQLARGRIRSKSKKSIDKMSMSKRGRPMHRNTRKALTAAVTRPKTRSHRHAISEAMKAADIIPPNCVRWTEAEIRLLGTEPDAVVAMQLGKSVDAVRKQRKRLNIPRFGS